MTVNPTDLFTEERADLSNFLIHLTKNGSYELYEPYHGIAGHYQWKKSENLQADASLKKILSMTPPTLEARAPFGHFKYDISVYTQKRRAVPLEWLKCVCFSEAPLRELRSFYRSTQQTKHQAFKANKYQKYGLAFFSSFVRNRKGHPIIYFDSGNDPIYESVDRLADPQFLNISRPLLPLLESFGPAKKAKVRSASSEIDFRWEREWRHVGSFSFNFSDVAFGLCPQERIKEFETLVKGQFPFIDPDWDADVLSKHLLSIGRKDLADAL